MNPESKTQKILRHLQKGFPLDNVLAWQLFKTTRLGGIIYELRKKHRIASKAKTTGPSPLYIYTYEGEIEDASK